MRENVRLLMQPALESPPVLLRFRSNPRARRYILRLARDGSAVVTIPRFGSTREAQAFAERNLDWIRRQVSRVKARNETDRSWKAGTEVLLEGQPRVLAVDTSVSPALVRLGEQRIGPHPEGSSDLRPMVELFLWRLAWERLPGRVIELNAPEGLPVRRITVRNQRSRWGSCSRRGTISLNWRLIQTPDFVRDYIILHELAHFRHMNHSAQFWAEVERLCPDYRVAETWLKQNGKLLGR